MSLMLPDELLLTAPNSQYPCRELQIRQLAYLLCPSLPNPSVLVTYGLEATGKSSIVKSVLDALGTTHAIVKSQECITARHLFERTIAACADAIGAAPGGTVNRDTYGRCENISALVVQLQLLLEGRQKFVLVLDGIDRQREAPPTLLPAIARFGEILSSTISNLTVVLIVTAPRPRFLHTTGVPHIHFPPYERTQSLAIVARSPLPIFPPSPSEPSLDDANTPSPDPSDEDSSWLWSRFTGAVWDSLAKAAARDIVSFRELCERLWQPFVQPIIDGHYGTRDFAKLMVKNRALFQGESALVESVIPRSLDNGKRSNIKDTHDLPYYTKYLILASYLASYNPSRQDPIFFTKASEKRRRKKGGGTMATPSRPSKRQHRKIERRLLGPQAFVLERLLAIFHAILPHPIVSTVDLMTQIATLASLRLLVRTSAGGDVLEAQAKWRVNVGAEFVANVARSVGFDVENYLAE